MEWRVTLLREQGCSVEILDGFWMSCCVLRIIENELVIGGKGNENE